jgi:S-formylglutathione hydrolase FrmB
MPRSHNLTDWRRPQLGLLALTLALGLFGSTGSVQAGGVAESRTAGPMDLECSQIQSTILSRAVSYCVALPGDYSSSGTRRYATLYFLHGLFESDRSWADRGGKEILDGLLAKGEVGPFIVVLPDGGKTFYINSFDGQIRYEDFFVQELIPFIDQHYRTIAQPAARAISGISMGGYGSLHLGMHHADLFSAASAQSAALIARLPNPLPTTGRMGFLAELLQGTFGSPLNEAYWEANSPLTLAEHPERFAGLKLYFDVGDQDRYGFQEGNEQLDQILKSKNFPHEFVLRSGNHGWDYEGMYMQYALLFHWRLFEPHEQAAVRAASAGESRR